MLISMLFSVRNPEALFLVYPLPTICIRLCAGCERKASCREQSISQTYDLEYGTATIEIHKDAIQPGQKVVIIDDLIATGGTTEAIIKMVEELMEKSSRLFSCGAGRTEGPRETERL